MTRKTYCGNQVLLAPLKLATISPHIRRAIINGQEPDGLTLAKIRDLETDDWSEQEKALGFVG